MLEFRADPDGRARLTITGPDGAGSFASREDYLVFPSPKGEVIDLEAPAVFLGYGFASEPIPAMILKVSTLTARLRFICAARPNI